MHRQVCIMDLRSRSASPWGEHIPMLTSLNGQGVLLLYDLGIAFRDISPQALEGDQ